MSDSFSCHLEKEGFSEFHHLMLLRIWISKSLLVICKSVLRYLFMPIKPQNKKLLEKLPNDNFSNVNLYQIMSDKEEPEEILKEIVRKTDEKLTGKSKISLDISKLALNAFYVL